MILQRIWMRNFQSRRSRTMSDPNEVRNAIICEITEYLKRVKLMRDAASSLEVVQALDWEIIGYKEVLAIIFDMDLKRTTKITKV